MLIVSIIENNIKISNFNKNLNIKEINFLLFICNSFSHYSIK